LEKKTSSFVENISHIINKVADFNQEECKEILDLDEEEVIISSTNLILNYSKFKDIFVIGLLSLRKEVFMYPKRIFIFFHLFLLARNLKFHSKIFIPFER